MEIPQFRPGQKIALLDFSNEVLSMFAEHVSTKNDATSIFMLSQCSRRLHEIAIPFLSYGFSETTKYPLETNQWLQKFLCRILTRPDLAKRVKRYKGDALSFHNPQSYTDEPETGLDMSAITEENWTRIRDAINVLEPDGVKTTLWDIERGSWEAMTTLVLSLLPNLEELEFINWPTYDDGSPSLMAFLSRAADRQNGVQGHLAPPPSPLAHLRRASLRFQEGADGLGMGELDPFLKLKSLRSISVHVLDSGGESDNDWEINSISSAPFHSNITEVNFEYSAISSQKLAEFLLCCPKLERFRYEHGGCNVGEAEFEPPRFMRALEVARSSLQELDILNEGGGEDGLESYPLGSFANFPKLKTINIETGILLGRFDSDKSPSSQDDNNQIFPRSMSLISALPPNIEHLTLCYDERMAIQLFELLENIHDFPSLKRLDIGWQKIVYPDKPSSGKPHSHPHFTSDEALKFLDLCEASGVKIVMTDVPPPDKIFHGWVNSNDNWQILLGSKWYAQDRSFFPKHPELGQHNMMSCTWLFLSYPYKGWEELCKAHGRDLETGKRPIGGGRMCCS